MGTQLSIYPYMINMFCPFLVTWKVAEGFTSMNFSTSSTIPILAAMSSGVHSPMDSLLFFRLSCLLLLLNLLLLATLKGRSGIVINVILLQSLWDICNDKSYCTKIFARHSANLYFFFCFQIWSIPSNSAMLIKHKFHHKEIIGWI